MAPKCSSALSCGSSRITQSLLPAYCSLSPISSYTIHAHRILTSNAFLKPSATESPSESDRPAVMQQQQQQRKVSPNVLLRRNQYCGYTERSLVETVAKSTYHLCPAVSKPLPRIHCHRLYGPPTVTTEGTCRCREHVGEASWWSNVVQRLNVCVVCVVASCACFARRSLGSRRTKRTIRD